MNADTSTPFVASNPHKKFNKYKFSTSKSKLFKSVQGQFIGPGISFLILEYAVPEYAGLFYNHQYKS